MCNFFIFTFTSFKNMRLSIIFIIIISPLNLLGQNSPIQMINFSQSSKLNNWRIMNDVVMGGVSKSDLVINQQGHVKFSGEISLDFNGGFASFRSYNQTFDVKGFSKILVHLKGDKKKYQIRIKENNSDYFSYVNTFESSGKWETIELSLVDFMPSYRGRILNLANFSGNKIDQIGVLIGNKKNEEFELIIDKFTLE